MDIDSKEFRKFVGKIYNDSDYADMLYEYGKDYLIKDKTSITWCPFCEVQRFVYLFAERNYRCPICGVVMRKFMKKDNIQLFLDDFPWYKNPRKAEDMLK